jgi:hypothetical protein
VYAVVRVRVRVLSYPLVRCRWGLRRTVYPILQSYALAGGFSVLEKLKTAIVENLLFYGIAGAILLVLLVIIAAKNRLDGCGTRTPPPHTRTRTRTRTRP